MNRATHDDANDADEPTPRSDFDAGPVAIYSAKNEAEAELLRERLAESGIKAWIDNASLAAAAGDLPIGLVINPRLVVQRTDMPRAAALLEEVLSNVRRMVQVTEASEVDEKSIAQDVAASRRAQSIGAWPDCPNCRKARLTQCPWCETSGADFPKADNDGRDEAERGVRDPTAAREIVLLICPTCDEPFEPRFWRRCAWCGHDFGSGIEDHSSPVRTPVDRRLALGMLATAAVVVGLMGYFAYLLR